MKFKQWISNCKNWIKKNIKWIIYTITILLGITLTILGEVCKNCEIMTSLGTGFLASWLTAMFIEITSVRSSKQKRNNDFIAATNELRSCMIDFFVIFNRTINDVDFLLKGERSKYKDKEFFSLCDYFIEKAKKVREESAYSQMLGDVTEEQLQKNRDAGKVNEILTIANKDFIKCREIARDIEEKVRNNQLLYISSGTCSVFEYECIKKIISLLATDENADCIYKEHEFFNFAFIVEELRNYVPAEIYVKLGLTKFNYSNEKGYLDCQLKQKENKKKNPKQKGKKK